MPRGRIQTLQALRAIAFLMVFASHCAFVEGPSGGALLNYAGAAGVSVFLVLTGFLEYVNGHGRPLPSGVKGAVGRVLVKVRRFYPLHVVTLLAALPFLALAVVRGGSALLALVELAFNASLLQSWVPDEGVYFSLNSVSWYLSTYLFLALISPYVVAAVRKLHWLGSPRPSVGTLAVLFAVELAWGLAVSALPVSHWIVYVFPPVRIFELIAGAIAGRLYVERGDAPAFFKISLWGGACRCG